MHAATDTFTGLILDWGFNIGAPTRPTAFFAALHSGPPGAAGASAELTGNAYARVAFTPERSSLIIRNTALIDFPAATPAAWSEALFASCWSASTAGTCYFTSPLTSELPRVFTLDDATADAVEIPAHGWADTDRVYLQQFAGVSLPGGLTKDTVYFVRDATTDDFRLAATSGGAAIAITTIGQGTLQKITNPRTAQIGDIIRFAATTLQFTLPAEG
jgi:hypothetical protein